jgi:NADPH:quinone reductase-like Zn-dependent oxidoreductase
MGSVKSYKQWSVSGTDKDFDGLSFINAQVDNIGEQEVLVKLYAASLNYRDLIIPMVRSSGWLSVVDPLLSMYTLSCPCTL